MNMMAMTVENYAYIRTVAVKNTKDGLHYTWLLRINASELFNNSNKSRK